MCPEPSFGFGRITFPLEIQNLMICQWPIQWTTLHEWLLFSLRGSSGFAATQQVSALRAHAARIRLFRNGLRAVMRRCREKPSIRCAWMSASNVQAWLACTRSESPHSALNVAMCMAQHLSQWALTRPHATLCSYRLYLFRLRREHSLNDRAMTTLSWVLNKIIQRASTLEQLCQVFYWLMVEFNV